MQPVAVIIDSIQTVYLDDVNGSAGSVSQVLAHTSTVVLVRCMPPSLVLLYLNARQELVAEMWSRVPSKAYYVLNIGPGVRHCTAARCQAGKDPHLPHWPRHQGAHIRDAFCKAAAVGHLPGEHMSICRCQCNTTSDMNSCRGVWRPVGCCCQSVIES